MRHYLFATTMLALLCVGCSGGEARTNDKLEARVKELERRCDVLYEAQQQSLQTDKAQHNVDLITRKSIGIINQRLDILEQ